MDKIWWEESVSYHVYLENKILEVQLEKERKELELMRNFLAFQSLKNKKQKEYWI